MISWVMTDYLIAGLILLSVAAGLWRGLLKETLALLTWAASAWIALHYASVLAGMLDGWIETPQLRIIAAFVMIFVGVFSVGVGIRYIIRALIATTGLGMVDRVLGGGFGFLRGAIIACVAIFVVSLTAYEQEPGWQDSQLVPKFQPFAQWMLHYVPQDKEEEATPLAAIKERWLTDFST